MKRICLIATAIVGLAAFASSASAALTYFDAQIVDSVVVGKGGGTFPANTVMCDPYNGCAPTPFTAMPITTNSTGQNSDAFSANQNVAAGTDPNGNWLNGPGGSTAGSDGLWRRRAANNFGNSNQIRDASGNPIGDVITAREDASSAVGSNSEILPVLKTTITVPAADRGATRGVYALFWADQSTKWQIAACLTCHVQEGLPVFRATTANGSLTGDAPGYVFEVFDAGQVIPDAVDNDGSPNLATNYPYGYVTSPFAASTMPTMLMDVASRYTSTDAGALGAATNRHLLAAYLGDTVLSDTLSVYVGHGARVAANQENSGNYRTWYDGIAYGDALGLEPIECVPEPASFALVGLALVGLGLIRRR